MSDLISRADAIEAIASRDETDGTVKAFTGREVNEILSALPSADAVEVVRCKDCKYLGIKDLVYGYCKHRMTGIVMPDDYCSHGERLVNSYVITETTLGGERTW